MSERPGTDGTRVWVQAGRQSRRIDVEPRETRSGDLLVVFKGIQPIGLYGIEHGEAGPVATPRLGLPLPKEKDLEAHRAHLEEFARLTDRPLDHDQLKVLVEILRALFPTLGDKISGVLNPLASSTEGQRVVTSNEVPPRTSRMSRERRTWLYSRASSSVAPNQFDFAGSSNVHKGDLVVLFAVGLTTPTPTTPLGIYEVDSGRRGELTGKTNAIAKARYLFPPIGVERLTGFQRELLRFAHAASERDTKNLNLHDDLIQTFVQMYADDDETQKAIAQYLGDPRATSSRAPLEQRGSHRESDAPEQNVPNAPTPPPDIEEPPTPDIPVATAPPVTPEIPVAAAPPVATSSHITINVLPFAPAQERDDDNVFWLDVNKLRVSASWNSEQIGAGKLANLDVLHVADPGRALYQAIWEAPKDIDQAGLLLSMSSAFDAKKKTSARVLLRIQDNELYQLPWEAMSGALSKFGIDEALPIARWVRGRDCEPVDGPLRIVCAIANPRELGNAANNLVGDLKPIDEEAEKARFLKAVQPLLRPDQAPVFVDATMAALAEEMAKGPHIFHILAHGVWNEAKQDYGLVLENKGGGVEVCYLGERDDATNLLAVLGSSPELRVVVLANCSSGAFTESGDRIKPSLGARLAEVVPTVVAMREAITADAVDHFARGFYAGLARTGETDRAAANGRNVMIQNLPNDAQWTFPVVFVGTTRPCVFVPSGEHKMAGAAATARAMTTPTRAIDDAISNAARAAGAAPELGQQIAAAVHGVLGPRSEPPKPNAIAQRRDDIARAIHGPVSLGAEPVLARVGPAGSDLVLPESVAHQTVAALNSGKHVIFIGPPGTGKTTLTSCLTELAQQNRFSAGTIAATASADWSTAETVGALLPSADGVAFRPGLVLDAILEGHWLVIDEINRAEIDKAFGELFTILSGQPITIPFGQNAKRVRVVPPHKEWRTKVKGLDPAQRWSAAMWEPEGVTVEDIVVHPNFRILASMNVYDRSFLFSMSLAFMRRFAFIDVDLPDNYATLIDQWLDSNHRRNLVAIAERDALAAKLRALIGDAPNACTTLQKHRALGPAILSDVLRYVSQRVASADWETALGEGVGMYVVPQLDGLAPEAVFAIERELAALLAKPVSRGRSLVCAKLRALYPHVDFS